MGVLDALPLMEREVSAGRVPAGEPFRRRGLGMGAGPLAVVMATVVWSLWEMRAVTRSAQFADDSSVHEQMVRFAAARFGSGHDPLTSWFPYVGLGSPQFLHYQSTPAMLTGLAGLVAGPDAAFRWSLYLLWCLWPVAVYGSARVFGLDRWPAALAGAMAPLLHSVPGIGYELHAYAWAGFGVWTQLWGSWALPFAWALSWRAMADKRFIAPAAALVAVTAAFHYETGYLAFGAVPIMPFLVWRGLRERLVRAAGLLAAALAASAWVVVPLLVYSRWAGINQVLAGTPLADGYGAKVTFGWLVTGRVFDAGRLPVVTVLVAAGLVVAVAGWRRPGPWRVLTVLLAAGVVLSCGRATFGGLVQVIPGSSDIFFRRFLMGGQLAGIYLAGLGAAELARQGWRLGVAGAGLLSHLRLRSLSWAPVTALALAGVAWLVPAWDSVDAQAALNAAGIGAQQVVQRDEGPQLAAIASYIRRHGGGRTYGGSLTDAGRYARVGFVPMYAYLESLDIDEVGYGLRTASLMSQSEFRFDPANPGDYALFGIRYLILPAGRPPSVPGAVLVVRQRSLRVFELPTSSYVRVADTVGSLTADRADVGSQTAAYLHTALPGQGRYLTVGYAGAAPAAPTLPALTSASTARPAGPPGTVMSEHADLADGRAAAEVRLRRRAVVVLSASYDPGWTVTVDGRPAATQMVAPALVAVTIPPGTHRVTFTYTGLRGYPWLFALAAAGLATAAATTLRHRRPGLPASTSNEEKSSKN